VSSDRLLADDAFSLVNDLWVAVMLVPNREALSTCVDMLPNDKGRAVVGLVLHKKVLFVDLLDDSSFPVDVDAKKKGLCCAELVSVPKDVPDSEFRPPPKVV
jgi:hypothetical protein